MLARKRLAPQAAVLAVERMAHLNRNAPWSQIVRSELEFHRALMEATRSERLVRVYSALQSEIGLCIVLQKHIYGSPAEVAAEHRQLLKVLETRGIGEVREAFRRHIGDTLAWLRPPEPAEPVIRVAKKTPRATPSRRR
jgi:DNA-binding FadR family transcriptional regulator